MIFDALAISDVIKIRPRIFKDQRGEFMETFKQSLFNDAVGRDIQFIQDNQSLSLRANTVRGLHYQSPPYAQGKLVRCVQGAIIDVAVDIRQGSSTYGQAVSAELTADNHEQLWVPEGFLHGFATLMDNTIVQYKCTNYYSPECDGNVSWNDADLDIDWGINAEKAVLSEKDEKAPAFKDFQSPFKL